MTSLAVWAGIELSEPSYCEVMPDGLVRTDAEEQFVNGAVAAVLEENRMPNNDPENRLVEAAYRESADAWFTTPDAFGVTYERASRLGRRQLGLDGEPMQIVVLRGSEMPTLVFVEHDSPRHRRELSEQIAAKLSAFGVQTR